MSRYRLDVTNVAFSGVIAFHAAFRLIASSVGSTGSLPNLGARLVFGSGLYVGYRGLRPVNWSEGFAMFSAKRTSAP
jgi:hypothetical protein